MPHTTIMDLQGYNGAMTKAHVAFYTPGQLVFVMTEHPENQSTPDTTLVPFIASVVWPRWCSPSLSEVTWIEHVLPYNHQFADGHPEPGFFSIVTFEKTMPPQRHPERPWLSQFNLNVVLRNHKTQPVRLSMVEELIGQPYAVPTFR